MATKPKRPRDTNQLAKFIVDLASGEADEPTGVVKGAAAVARGRKGGLKGGVSRMSKLSDAERSALAQSAAEARWKKKAPGCPGASKKLS